jgi:acyl-CoA reductase-like NAD-dependent aldehyde dehydrogenase
MTLDSEKGFRPNPWWPAGKVMGAKQLAEAIHFAKQMRYPLGSTIFGDSEDDYLYFCPNSKGTYVCCYMADNVGFPKLKAMLPTMSEEDFSDCLTYTHLKVILLTFVFLASGYFDKRAHPL